MGMWKHLRAIILLPGVALIIVPTAIIIITGEVNLGWDLLSPYELGLILIGCILILAGLILLYKTISQFASLGKGTLAPWDPTQRLVVQGVYRHVRNPMISGVLFVLFGEALIFGSLPLIYWFLFFVLVNAVYIPLFEERGLSNRFGDDYLTYKRNVPRWLPRLKPWTPVFDQRIGDSRHRCIR